MNGPDQDPRQARPRRPWLRWTAIAASAALSLAILATVGVGLLGFYLLRSDTKEWDAHEQFLATHDNADMLRMAESLEHKLLAAFEEGEAGSTTGAASDQPSPHRGSGGLLGPATAQAAVVDERIAAVVEDGEGSPQVVETNRQRPKPREVTVELTTAELKSWVAVKSDTWLANQGKQLPKEISQPMIDVQQGKLVVGFRFDTPELSQKVQAEMKMQPQGDGEVFVRLEALKGGRLPVDAGMVSKHLRKQSDANKKSDAVAFLQKLEKGVTIDPGEHMKEFRDRDITGIDMTEQGMKLRMRKREKSDD